MATITYRIYRLSETAAIQLDDIEKQQPQGNKKVGHMFPGLSIVELEAEVIVLCEFSDHVYQAPIEGVWVFPSSGIRRHDGTVQETTHSPAGKIRRKTHNIKGLCVRPPSVEERERARVVKSLEELFQYEPTWRKYFMG